MKKSSSQEPSSSEMALFTVIKPVLDYHREHPQHATRVAKRTKSSVEAVLSVWISHHVDQFINAVAERHHEAVVKSSGNQPTYSSKPSRN